MSGSTSNRTEDHAGSSRDVVVIGASAGGVQALSEVMRGLPADLPVAVFVVLHVTASGHSMLAPILSRSGRLVASAARDGEPIVCSRVYVAPPGVHMRLGDGVVALSHAPFEKGSRPSINVLFRSAAEIYGERVIGVILSGLLDDGVDGLRAIKRRGGATVVQEPADAQFDGMPRAAMQAVAIDRVAPAARIPEVLIELVGGDDRTGATCGREAQMP